MLKDIYTTGCIPLSRINMPTTQQPIEIGASVITMLSPDANKNLNASENNHS
jgi:hypothetical protein